MRLYDARNKRYEYYDGPKRAKEYDCRTRIIGFQQLRSACSLINHLANADSQDQQSDSGKHAHKNITRYSYLFRDIAVTQIVMDRLTVIAVTLCHGNNTAVFIDCISTSILLYSVRTLFAGIQRHFTILDILILPVCFYNEEHHNETYAADKQHR